MQIHDAHPPTEPLDFLQAWGAAHSSVKVHHLDSPSPVQSTPASGLLSSVPRNPSVPDEAIQALLGAGVCISLTEGGSSCKSKADETTARSRKLPPSSAQRCIALRGDRVFKFERPEAQLQPFNFATASSSPRHGDTAAGLLKRVRHGLDVDGPNTANLGCKKRRLRIELITSRLSRAYSQPATHILNREGQKSGDKRFLKMATSSLAPMARRISHLRATSYVRYSTLNLMRQRMGSSWPLVIPVTLPEMGQPQMGSGTQKDAKEGNISVFELKCKAQWRPPSLLTASRGQFVLPEGKTVDAHAPGSPSHPLPPRSASPLSSRALSALVAKAASSLAAKAPSPLSSRTPSVLQPRASSALAPRPSSALWQRAPPGSSHRAPIAPSPPPPPRSKVVQANRPPKPAPASPASHPSDTGAAKCVPPKLPHPVSSPNRSIYDDLEEEDSFAGRHLLDDDFSDSADDPDQVYSDFSVIFNADNNKKEKEKKRKEKREKKRKAKKEGEDGDDEGGDGKNSEDSESDDEDGSYEEFLDELDGISWVAL